MPPLKGIDRGLNGSALKALEESGHGRRLAIVDASYNIPRWAQVIDYRGSTSLQALVGVVKLVPVEGKVLLMQPDAGSPPEHFDEPFYHMAGAALDNATDILLQKEAIYRLDTDSNGYPAVGNDDLSQGFYSIVDNEAEDTLYLRTVDKTPYACASFVIGHSQDG